MQKIKLIRLFAILGLLSLIATGCVYNPPHRTSVSYSVSSGHVEPWGYYYYPDSQVYFHYSSGFYYYPSGSIWVRTRFLPKYFSLNPEFRVRLHIESNKPYVFHHQHREKYRPNPKRKVKPGYDRKERHLNRDRYERQHCPDPKGRVHIMKPEGVLCAKPVRNDSAPHTRPTPKPRYERDKHESRQPPIRFDSPPQHKPIPMGPEETRDKAKARKRHEEPRRKQEKHSPSHPRQHDSSQGKRSKGKEQRKHKKDHRQEEEEVEQVDRERKRSKKQRREEERGKRYR